MSVSQQPYVVHAVTPLHVGIEDSLGGIDLPTMRERHTGYPLLPGSSVKGVLRAECQSELAKGQVEALAAFGPTSDLAGDYRGGLVFTDALLLALPVRSLAGTFSWVSCPLILRRLNRDLGTCPGQAPLSIPQPAIDRGLVPASKTDQREADSALVVLDGGRRSVFVEELLLEADPDAGVSALANRIAAWCWPTDLEAQVFFRQRFLVIHDDLFRFLTRLAMEVRARVRIDPESGTAADTGPWTEEHLPAETILYGVALGRPTTHLERPADAPDGEAAAKGKTTPRSGEESLDFLRRLVCRLGLIRFGGHSTIGLGRAFFRLVAEAPAAGGGQ